jgi:hypothetical protein
MKINTYIFYSLKDLIPMMQVRGSVHTFNPSFLGDRDRENGVLEGAKSHLNKQAGRGDRCL